MVSVEDVDRVFQTLGQIPGADQDQWNTFLNLLIEGGPIYAVVTGGPYRVAIFAQGPDDTQPVMFAYTNREESQRANVPVEQLGLCTLTDFVKVAEAIPTVIGVVVNPASKGIVVSRDILLDMHRFRTEPQPRTVPARAIIRVGDPAAYPHSLVQDLAHAAKSHPIVNRMWLRQMSMNGEESYLVVIDAPQRDEAVLRAFGVVVNDHPELDLPVDLVMRPTESIGDSFSGPFYSR